MIQPGGPGHQERDSVALGVIKPLDQIAPAGKFVNLIQYHKLLAAGQFPPQQVRTNVRIVPAQVSGVPWPIRLKKRQGQRRLAHLAGTAEKYHFALKIVLDRAGEIAREHLRLGGHGTRLRQTRNA